MGQILGETVNSPKGPKPPSSVKDKSQGRGGQKGEISWRTCFLMQIKYELSPRRRCVFPGTRREVADEISFVKVNVPDP